MKTNRINASMQDVCVAVNAEFGASLLPDKLISAVLLLSLSHGLLVETSQHSELQRVRRQCGISSSDEMGGKGDGLLSWKKTYRCADGDRCGSECFNNEAVTCSVSSSLTNLVTFRDRGYLSTVKPPETETERCTFNDFSFLFMHCPVGVESWREVCACVHLQRGFSRCFRSLIETFTLPELAPWLAQVLYCAPFTYQRMSEENCCGKIQTQLSSRLECSASASPFSHSAGSPSASENGDKDDNCGSTGPRVTKKMHQLSSQSRSHNHRNRRGHLHTEDPPTAHALAILGVFASAGNAFFLML